MSWLNRALQVNSKGLSAKKARRLADLHTRRNTTQSQYYTPAWIAKNLWALLTPSLYIWMEEKTRISVFDNSVGNGRLLADAPVERCYLYGCDTDERCIDALSQDAAAANIHHEFVHTGMEALTARDFDLAIINPPFSLNLQSPLMEPYPCTCFGKYGPHTSANSHEYALDQALDAASVVVALLPVSMRERCYRDPRLVAEYILPADSFKFEGAQVRTALYFFDSHPSADPGCQYAVTQEGNWPALPTLTLKSRNNRDPVFRAGGVDYSAPVISTPVTHNKTVTLHHHNRKLILKFQCGLTQAKIMNALLEDVTLHQVGHRYPKNINYIGDGKLLLDVYLLQPDPQAAFNQTLQIIRDAGGDPVVSPTLQGYWKKLLKRHLRAALPYRHVIKTANNPTLTLTTKRGMLLEQGNVKSPALKKGHRLEAIARGGEYDITYQGWSVTYRRDQLQQLFSFDDGVDERADAQWQVIHEGLPHHFPELNTHYQHLIQQVGIDWLWPYQEFSLIEQLMRPYGGIAGWQPGTGKARLAIAMGLCSSGCALVALESGLLKEMVRELDKIQLSHDQWQVLHHNCDRPSLKSINFVTYNTLKKKDRQGRTLAQRLRRAFHTVIADEGGILSNPDSQQSRAVVRLAPKRLYVLDGSPIGSYPRDLMPLAQATVGGGVAHQPYALHNGPYLTSQMYKTASMCQRGVDAFRDKHVVLEWATNEFNDDLRQGAKREIPKINHLPEFRRWLAPFVQRRLRKEPDVAPYAGCPDPEKSIHLINWDREHLAHYLDTSVNFAHWYTTLLRARQMEGKGINLVAILARLNEVIAAANHPHVKGKNTRKTYTKLTSKQRYAIKRIENHVHAGRKTILYAKSPKLIQRLHAELEKRGIRAIAFHGEFPIDQRIPELDKFRYGSYEVLLSSWVGQRGLNIPEAKAVLFYNRHWTADVEEQALDRTQRPEQNVAVQVEYLHLRGSIDEYMAQIVNWKESAADAALDWGDGATDSDVFHHMDAVLANFCRDTLNMSIHDASKYLNAA